MKMGNKFMGPGDSNKQRKESRGLYQSGDILAAF